MTELLFAAPEWPLVPVVGSDALYPVGRIFCVGRNYVEHAKEMGSEVDREAPFFFLKAAQAIVPSGATIPYPPGTRELHHEMELVVAIGASAFGIAAEDALAAVFGYAAGLDLTRRDLQGAAKAKQRPWDLGKNFENSAPIGPITPADRFAVADQGIRLSVNGSVRQDARLSELVWPIADLVSHLSRYYHLVPGDLIFTGTPAGVGPLLPGDDVVGEIDGLEPVTLTIEAAR